MAAVVAHEHDLHQDVFPVRRRDEYPGAPGAVRVIWCSTCPLYVEEPADMPDYRRAAMRAW